MTCGDRITGLSRFDLLVQPREWIRLLEYGIDTAVGQPPSRAVSFYGCAASAASIKMDHNRRN